jgi:hypothetical protein
MRRRTARRSLPTAAGLAAGLVALLVGCSCASAAVPPSIESESASNITPTDATLEAQINPGDAPGGVYYQFQIASNLGEYVSEIVCPPEPSSGPAHPCIGAHSSGALPIGFIAAGSGPSSVSLDLAGTDMKLQPGTSYQFRVLVAKAVQTEDTIEWEAPSIVGDVQAFTTPPNPTPPPTADPQTGSAGQPAIQASSPSHPRRHHRRHHRKHNLRSLHRGKVGQASLAD